MHLEAAVPCVAYDDFLQITLPANRTKLPSITVLTAPWDLQTISIAREHSVKLMVTDSWRRGGSFNKARALNEWLDRITLDAIPETWLLLLDADILIPPGKELLLDQLDPTGLYSARRRMCMDPSSFLDYSENRRTLQSFPLRIPPIRNGRAWGHFPTSNPAALSGYMQLWCPDGSDGLKRFPESQNAAGYDVTFALSFPEEKRYFLQDIDVLHLGPPKVNWNGRSSARWSP
jgi:hypothetical protein